MITTKAVKYFDKLLLSAEHQVELKCNTISIRYEDVSRNMLKDLYKRFNSKAIQNYTDKNILSCIEKGLNAQRSILDKVFTV
jgi:hypothetical protein